MPNNQYFCDANQPFSSIVRMFNKMADDGSMNDDMLEALHLHAQNAIATMPGNIACLSRALACAAESDILSSYEVSQAANGIADLAEQLNGFTTIIGHLPEKSRSAGRSTSKVGGAA